MVRVERPSGLIKEDVECKYLVRVAEFAWLKVENVSWEQISVINLNHYMILENVLVIEFFVPNWFFSILFSFTKLIQIFLYQIKSNNWTIQIIEFFNLKSPNFFKFRIDIETISAFLLLSNWATSCQIFKIDLLIHWWHQWHSILWQVHTFTRSRRFYSSTAGLILLQ
jgi:hypothetical protein